MLDAADEEFHEWPADAGTTWKENWYWNMADRAAGVWGFCHASFVRSKGKAVFAACFLVDGRVRFHRNEFATVGKPVLDDGVLRAEIIVHTGTIASSWRQASTASILTTARGSSRLATRVARLPRTANPFPTFASSATSRAWRSRAPAR